MAVFNKNTLNQTFGFDNQILAGELVWQQRQYWNISLGSDITGVDITAQIVRRNISDVVDTRNGLTFNITNYTPTPTPISLTITNRIDATGVFTVVIDDSTWGLIAADPELDINAQDCVAFSGRIKISFPAPNTTPAYDSIIFLLFLVRSDGVMNV